MREPARAWYAVAGALVAAGFLGRWLHGLDAGARPFSPSGLYLAGEIAALAGAAALIAAAFLCGRARAGAGLVGAALVAAGCGPAAWRDLSWFGLRLLALPTPLLFPIVPAVIGLAAGAAALVERVRLERRGG